VETVCREATDIPEHKPAIIATGPLTTEQLAEAIRGLTGSEHLYYYDATSPIVSADSIDYDKVFFASRYGKGAPDFLNCPMSEEEYFRFVDALLAAPRVVLREFEEPRFFEGCLPIEEMAARGPLTLAHGPLKPVGLVDPRSGRRPFAVVQLRREDVGGQAYELVGFQTRLVWSAQREVFRLIPGLENAEFLRFGAMHRNTYICSPRFLDRTQQFRGRPGLFFAGQITGVEGYIESAASGLLAGVAAAHLIRGAGYVPPPPTTAHGALMRYIAESDPSRFQPSNIHFGLLDPPGDRRLRGRARKEHLARRALDAIRRWRDELAA
ncbi:MAG TPA: methylenetetrahydrofolate--tRNA-(uracil(54)-C(5))-methyltransferase (FADH(2)-oxidizing) TrmFO, partial [Proteobacteria bacterium]|nr:methylenetetrahydrofolate--tRNA-(uracil(54)-C(5))-methyltransferase (FADH(2)-oxidizing) TrmFO [Pseudomonadota bacterium]